MTKFKTRIHQSSKDSRIILANDYDIRNEKLVLQTIKNIKTLHKYLCGIKLNFHLLLPLGKKDIIKITKTAHQYGLQTIADIKLNDIGNTNLVTTKTLWGFGFDAVIVNPIMGPESLKKIVTAAHKQDKGVIALCHMSAPEAKLYGGLSHDFEIWRPTHTLTIPLYQLFLEWAIFNNVDGIIVGATFPEIIKKCKWICKEIYGKKLDIYSPGIGTQGGDAKQAIGNGSDFLIVGRTILNSKDPVYTAKQLLLAGI